jgi:hypothetical protein
MEFLEEGGAGGHKDALASQSCQTLHRQGQDRQWVPPDSCHVWEGRSLTLAEFPWKRPPRTVRLALGPTTAIAPPPLNCRHQTAAEPRTSSAAPDKSTPVQDMSSV